MQENEIQQKIKEGSIRTKIIIEIAGFPKEHIEKTMLMLVERISKEDIEILSKDIKPCKLIGEKIWSSFLELEILTAGLAGLLGIIFDYLPSSVDIIEPVEKVNEQTVNINDLLNDLIAKLHEYNHEIKILQAQNQILGRELMKFKDKVPRTPKVNPGQQETKEQKTESPESQNQQS